ncbi:MAG: DUF2760 domain-containing protein [Candidatus Eremiobacteraeota bacterium]|nr:DUF2760 domain-containing protein [Candidatus Eremiobacteraeota bacterium]
MGGFIKALQLFFQVLRDRELAEGIERLKSGQLCDPARVLYLFQREARFVDFIKEDLEGIGDAQVGAVARTLHQGCRKILKEYLVIEPVRSEEEGSPLTVEKGFDPSAIRLVGNVSGEPPFKGTLAHHGWKLASSKVPAAPSGQDSSIIQPAEVEL